ncbi:GNAT family N-acetyltransferase [bacterium]|nr:GNAT family N-acetyltransferase [bacterium]
MDFVIRPLSRENIPLLRGFPPDSWHFDICGFMNTHFGEPYFYPVVAVSGYRIVGTANGILSGDAGWLGNIIVLPEFRGRGIGTALTEHLVGYFHSKKCRTQLLVATDMGEPVYRKFGFRRTLTYRFFKGCTLEGPADARIREMETRDFPAVIELDRRISAEDRAVLIGKFFPGARVFEEQSGHICGFFLPAFGAGLVIAEDPEAGVALLAHKHSIPDRITVVPESNSAALDFMIRNGFEEVLGAPRMVLGPERQWKPECVFCRAAGYCG